MQSGSPETASGGRGAFRFLPPLALGLFALACGWFLLPGSVPVARVYNFYYDYLADSFLEGHTHLDLQPDPRLTALPDPYDPALNRRWRLGDASLYHGKFYLYFGPGPALALFAPYKLLTGFALRQSAASFGVAGAALGLMALFLRDALRRYRPQAGDWSWAGAVMFGAMGSWLFVTVQRSMIFEVSIVCGAGGLLGALFFLWKGASSDKWSPWALALGLSLAFCVASRVTYAPAAALVLGAALWSGCASRADARRNLRSLALGAFLPVLACIASLLAYNRARFGDAWEFGQRYQLNVSYDQKINPRVINPRFIPFNLREYLFATPTLSRFFPFVLPQEPPVLPPGYISSEGMHGILMAVPVNLFAVAGAAWIWRRRARPGYRPLLILGAAAAACALANAFILLGFKGTTSRYTAELLAPVLPLTAIGLGVAFSSRSRLVRLGAAALGIYSSAYVVFAATAAYDNLERLKHPRAYVIAARACDAAADLLLGHPYRSSGPIELQLALRPFTGPASAWILSGGRPDARFYLTLTRPDADHIQLAVQSGNENDHDALWLTRQAVDSIVMKSPKLRSPPGPFMVRLAAPWLYPPAEDGYWNPIPAQAERDWLHDVVLMAPGLAFGIRTTDMEEWDGHPPRINSSGGGQVEVLGWRYLSASAAVKR